MRVSVQLTSFILVSCLSQLSASSASAACALGPFPCGPGQKVCDRGSDGCAAGQSDLSCIGVSETCQQVRVSATPPGDQDPFGSRNGGNAQGSGGGGTSSYDRAMGFNPAVNGAGGGTDPGNRVPANSVRPVVGGNNTGDGGNAGAVTNTAAGNNPPGAGNNPGARSGANAGPGGNGDAGTTTGGGSNTGAGGNTTASQDGNQPTGTTSTGGSSVTPSGQSANGSTSPEAAPGYAAIEAQRLKDGRARPESESGGIGHAEGADSCKVSHTLNGSYGCDTTRNVVEGAKITNTIAQVGGAAFTSAQGQSSLNSAQTQGTQSALMKAGASTQETTGMIQGSMGMANAAVGALQLYMARSHSANKGSISEELDKKNFGGGTGDMKNDGTQKGDHGYIEAKKGSETANNLIEKFNLNERVKLQAVNSPDQQLAAAQTARRKEDWNVKTKDFNSQRARIVNSAQSEQDKMAKEANLGAVASLIAGAQQMVSGYFNVKAGKEMEAAAKSLANTEKAGPVFVPTQTDTLANGDTLAPRSATTITGTGAGAPVQAAADATAPTGVGGGLGDPFKTSNDNPNNLTSAAPPGGAPLPNDPKAAGGGGGGGMGNNSTQPDKGSGPEGTPTLADNKGKDFYESAGGANRNGGGGAGANGPDLSNLLAQFLPKKEDDTAKGNGILKYGDRGPASANAGANGDSILGRDANLFQRVHDAYQDNQRRRRIGG